jgi:MinD-like ATPase involved in chromosome partitioning or flagellar assembly
MSENSVEEHIVNTLTKELLKFVIENKIDQPSNQRDGERVVQQFQRHMNETMPKLAEDVDALGSEQELCMWTGVAEELDWPDFEE